MSSYSKSQQFYHSLPCSRPVSKPSIEKCKALTNIPCKLVPSSIGLLQCLGHAGAMIMSNNIILIHTKTLGHLDLKLVEGKASKAADSQVQREYDKQMVSFVFSLRRRLEFTCP